ncbi:uncharacterized protein LOC131001095 [Salvia miltiorrhiza]|uniref:uncharacterized protein LOC131001095 n=1 Tax=Salvia miltiorrhiza TaxID=226208 RepID=UPI0025AD0A9E|nr:uncharacterized protein LOC131001095 [Salvia miltiorrhiza]
MARRKDLSAFERAAIIQFLLEGSHNGKQARGKINAAVQKWSCCRRTISRIWAAANKQRASGEVISSLSKKKLRPRRKLVHLDLNLVASLELSKRSTIRRLACGIKCSKSTVGRWIKLGLIRPHSSAIKPDLTAPNKLLRLRFSLEALEYDRILRSLTFFHIDEKWFYITKSNQRFYLTPDEIDPHRTCKNKKFITKVMFMCAPKETVRTGHGTMEWKPIQSITKQVVKDCLIYQWLLKMYDSGYLRINAVAVCMYGIVAVASADGFDIHLVHQPPNSPDTNINDLGWFRAIQSLQTESMSTNVDGLVNAVIKSFNELSPSTLNKVFISLQSCMVEILKVKGRNSYKIPHLGKDALIRQDMLPLNLQVPSELVRECLSYLIENGALSYGDTLMNELGVQAGCTDEVEMMVHQLQIQGTEVM